MGEIKDLGSVSKDKTVKGRFGTQKKKMRRGTKKKMSGD